ASVCSNEGCTVRIHYYCLKKKFPQRKGSRACPGCGTEWPRSVFEVDHLDVPDQTQVPSAELSSRKRPDQIQVPLAELSSRKRPRRMKAEAVAAVQSQSETQNEAPCGPPQRRRLRSCKTESVET
ncbi:hypothetical protein B296_00024038, partial [Ensete ventricosum]